MANVIIITGDTGSGKSTSIKTLNPKETYIINVLGKPLPFKGSSNMYNEENKNIYTTDNYLHVKQLLELIPLKRPEIKNIIIDDAGFLMTTEFFKRASETGYIKFTEIGQHMQSILEQAKNIKEDINVVFMFHDDNEYSDRIKTNKKIKLIGQMLEDKYNPLSVVSICLFTDVSFDKDNQPRYEFITNRTKIDNIIIPAKSPDGMFPLRIPNDLNFVFNKIREYYGQENNKKTGTAAKVLEKTS